MLTAYHPPSSGKVNAADHQAADGPFFCPACGSELRLRKGLKRIHHFFHPSEKTCHYRGESQLHLRIKKQMYFTLIEELGYQVKKVEIEKMIDNIRPDVFVEGFKKKIGIEIQVTPLTPAELIRRTVAYYQKKIHLLWVLPFSHARIFAADDQEFQPIRLKVYEQMLFYMYYKNLIFWDDTEKYSKGFIALQLKDVFQGDRAFYSKDWSTVIRFSPKKLKQTKLPYDIEYNLPLKSFIPIYAPPFRMPGMDFWLPGRFIMGRKT